MTLLCFASRCCFTFGVFLFFFWTCSSCFILSEGPVCWNLRPQTTLWTAPDSWQHGGFGWVTEVHFFSPSPPKAAILMPVWTQPSCSPTRQKNDEQRLALFKEDAKQLLQPQALVHRVRIRLCVESFCDCDYSDRNMIHAHADVQEVLESRFHLSLCLASVACFCLFKHMICSRLIAALLLRHHVYSCITLCWCLSGGFMCYILLFSCDVSSCILRVEGR